jgi:hypothetical protein
MTTYHYQLVEYDLSRPWVVVNAAHHTVDLPDDQDFDRWARQRFPDDRYRVLVERAARRWPPLGDVP